MVRSLRERLLKDLGDAVQSTYRLSLKAEQAGLDEEATRRRARLESWLAEQVRSGGRAAKEARDRHLADAVKRAAATLLNRLVVLRQAEALGLTRVKVLTGGWESPGYREFRDFASALLGDETEGYAELFGGPGGRCFAGEALVAGAGEPITKASPKTFNRDNVPFYTYRLPLKGIVRYEPHKVGLETLEKVSWVVPSPVERTAPRGDGNGRGR